MSGRPPPTPVGGRAALGRRRIELMQGAQGVAQHERRAREINRTRFSPNEAPGPQENSRASPPARNERRSPDRLYGSRQQALSCPNSRELLTRSYELARARRTSPAAE